MAVVSDEVSSSTAAPLVVDTTEGGMRVKALDVNISITDAATMRRKLDLDIHAIPSSDVFLTR